MPTTYTKAPKQVLDLANAILCEYPDHQPLLDARVRLDILMAHAPVDEKTGKPIGFAMKEKNRRILGKCRIVNLRDRAKGNGDAEILLDADHWAEVGEAEQKAILDHELRHLAVQVNTAGVTKTDDLSRPKLSIRYHDFECGWFHLIAERHGAASQERQQASALLAEGGQYYWPSLVKA